MAYLRTATLEYERQGPSRTACHLPQQHRTSGRPAGNTQKEGGKVLLLLQHLAFMAFYLFICTDSQNNLCFLFESLGRPSSNGLRAADNHRYSAVQNKLHAIGRD